MVGGVGVWVFGLFGKPGEFAESGEWGEWGSFRGLGTVWRLESWELLSKMLLVGGKDNTLLLYLILHLIDDYCQISMKQINTLSLLHTSQIPILLSSVVYILEFSHSGSSLSLAAQENGKGEGGT